MRFDSFNNLAILHRIYDAINSLLLRTGERT